MNPHLANVLPLLYNLAFAAVLLCVAWLVNLLIERRHLASLARREAAMRDLPVCNLRQLPANWQVESAFLVTGSVVMGADYFRTRLANLQHLIGGNLRGYERLRDLATREARLRLLEQARAHDAQAVWCVRIETFAVTSGRSRVSGIEVFASGTAIRLK